MKEQKSTVYIETTVISYLTSRPSRDLIVAAHQQITHDWWDITLPKFDAFISVVVLDEISRGDSQASRLRLQQAENFPILELNPKIVTLADTYFDAIQLPERARLDSYHLALATWHGMDFLVSWNCTHIASGKVRKIIEITNGQLGIQTPIICTPEELMEV